LHLVCSSNSLQWLSKVWLWIFDTEPFTLLVAVVGSLSNNLNCLYRPLKI
jgi:hypothetical protein